MKKNKYDDNLSIGENIIRNNVWHSSKYGSIPLNTTQDKNWDIDPFNNRSWIWLYQQLFFINDLLQYDRTTNSNKGLMFALAIIKNWDEYYKSTPYSNQVVWHDHASALRLRRLLDIKNILTTKEIWNDEKHSWLIVLIEKHIDFLRSEKYYSKDSNHGLDQSISFFLALMHFTEASWFQEYLSVCNKRLTYEVERMFDSEGGHFENSTGYQALGITQLIMVKTLLNQYPKYAITLDLKKLINDATYALAFMITPLGTNAPIGDTEAIPHKDLFPSHSKPSSHTNYIFALSQGKEGLAPQKNSLILPVSGWAAYRNDWIDSNDFHLLAKCGFNSDYHRQDDDTSFVLFNEGEEWLTDSGLYKYHEQDKNRIFVRSLFAHNLSYPVNAIATRKLTQYKGKSTLKDLLQLNDVNTVFNIETNTDIIENYHVQRKIKISKNLNFQISDKITPKHDIFQQSYSTRFIIPADKKIEINQNYIEIIGKKSKLRIQLMTTNIHFKLALQQINISHAFNTLTTANAVDFMFDNINIFEVEYNCSWIKI